MKLAGKTEIVTGCARNTGRTISVRLASYGTNPVINYPNGK